MARAAADRKYVISHTRLSAWMGAAMTAEKGAVTGLHSLCIRVWTPQKQRLTVTFRLEKNTLTQHVQGHSDTQPVSERRRQLRPNQTICRFGQHLHSGLPGVEAVGGSKQKDV